MGLLVHKDQKVIKVLVRRDPRANLAFTVHLEHLVRQVSIQAEGET